MPSPREVLHFSLKNSRTFFHVKIDSSHYPQKKLQISCRLLTSLPPRSVSETTTKSLLNIPVLKLSVDLWNAYSLQVFWHLQQSGYNNGDLVFISFTVSKLWELKIGITHSVDCYRRCTTSEPTIEIMFQVSHPAESVPLLPIQEPLRGLRQVDTGISDWTPFITGIAHGS